MRRFPRGPLLLGLLILLACESPATEPTTPAPASGAPAQSTPTRVPRPTSEVSPATLPPPPDPFDADWENLEVFRAGLVASEQDILERLTGLTMYRLDLTLSDDWSTVNGHEQIRYTNTETEALDEIQFRLYPNLLGGSMSVRNLTADGISVQAGYRMEDSVMVAPLPEPLKPGESALMEMDFEVNVPDGADQNYGILSAAESTLSYAHGYPVISLYDERGWNAQIPSEWGDITVADAAYYLVRIAAPANLKVSASGSEVSHRAEAGMQEVTFAAGPARDFYFAATPAYQITRRQAGDTILRAFALPEHTARVTAALDAAEAALGVYETRYGPYPYTELDLAVTPTYALGVEYPGIIALNEDMFTPEEELKVIPEEIWLESTVAHEVAHQWYYNVVGDDQLAEPWLDEAIAQYATWVYYRDAKSAFAARAFEESLRARWGRVDDEEIPIGMPVSSYDPTSYGAIIYGRGPLFVEELRRQMGDSVFDAFIRDYALKQRWQVATTEDFKSTAELHCGCDLTPLFDAWVYP